MRRREQRKERERQREHQKEQQDKSFEQSLHKHGQQNAGNIDPGFQKFKADLLSELSETGMTDAGINRLSNLMDSVWVKANQTKDDIENFRWWLEYQFMLIENDFPHPDSNMQGPWRAFLADDPTENIYALNTRQKTILEQAKRTLKARITMSKDGFAVKEVGRARSESVVKKQDDEGDDGRRSITSIFD